MTERQLTSAAIVKHAGLSDTERSAVLENALVRRVLKWVREHMVQIVEECPDCGAVEEDGETHADDCDYVDRNDA